MLDICFSFPGPTCFAVGLLSQDSSVEQLIYLPRTQVLGSSSTFPRLNCGAVDLPSHDSSFGQLI